MGRDSRILFRQILTSSVELFGIGHEAPRRPSAHPTRLNLSLPTPQHPSPYPASSHIPKTQNNCVARGEEREEGKRPFATTSASPPRKFPLLQKQNLFTKKKIDTKKRDHQPNKSPTVSKKEKLHFYYLFFIIYSLPSPASPQLSEPHSSHPAEEQCSE